VLLSRLVRPMVVLEKIRRAFHPLASVPRLLHEVPRYAASRGIRTRPNQPMLFQPTVAP
jgi:hypothetical protein